MGGLEEGGLDTHFEKEKTENELFSDADLKEFTTLIENETDFNILLQ